jgi:hypothetical protein
MRYEIRGTMDDQGERQEVDHQSDPQGATRALRFCPSGRPAPPDGVLG